MNIPLNVLIDASDQLKYMIEKAEPILDNQEYRKLTNAYFELHAEVVSITKKIKVEVTE
jgi:hypothetical protein